MTVSHKQSLLPRLRVFFNVACCMHGIWAVLMLFVSVGVIFGFEQTSYITTEGTDVWVTFVLLGQLERTAVAYISTADGSAKCNIYLYLHVLN